MKSLKDSTRKSGKSAAVRPQLSIVADTRPIPDNRVSFGNARQAKIRDDNKATDTYKALRELLQRAEEGHILSFAFVVQYQDGKDENKRHEPGATGGYVSDPVLMMGAVSLLMKAATECGE